MISDFQKFTKKEELLGSGCYTLLAVSGGVDSVVMCELFHKAKLRFGIAHCNFRLRGKESDDDELFVEKLAEKYGVPYHSAAFDTASYAKAYKLSIQEAARDLRYAWFHEIMMQFGYNNLSTAHHRDDSTETFFINLVRGTGIAGLHGILPKQGLIIRPLLFASKKEIISFAKKNKITFREDSSNESDKYLRNKIRKKLIPLLQSINPEIDQVMEKNILNIRSAEKIYDQTIEEKRNDVLTLKNGAVFLSISKLKDLQPLHTYLYEFLIPYGFNSSTVSEIHDALEGTPGKKFYSSSYRLIKDRKDLIIELLNEDHQSENEIIVNENQKKLTTDNLKITFKKLPAGTKFSRSVTCGAFDLDKLSFPLVVRKWKKGDSFQPFGMKGKKKVSDFFTDQKFSIAKKEKTWLLTSEDQVIWIIGHRIDDRFKVTDTTKKIYFAEFIE